MKDIVKVSISGVAFLFEEDAYLAMKDYLDKLARGYSGNPDGREIIADIEARIAELILSRQESEEVVTKDLAEMIVAQLGFPDDMPLADDIPVEEIPRRLYRNPEGAVVAGVCSGIASYFKVDPVWVRLGFFAPIILRILLIPTHAWGIDNFMGSLFFVFILLYFILWFAIPLARTPRQKLEMRGQKITASSIRQNLEETSENVSTAPSPKRERNASVWADLIYGVGRILQFFIKAVVIFIGFIFAIVAVCMLVALVMLIFGGEIVLGSVTLELFSGLHGITPAAYGILILLAVFMPMLVIGYLLVLLIFGSRPSKSFLTVIGVIWLLITIYLSVMTVRNIDNLRKNAHELKDGIEQWQDSPPRNGVREEWRQRDHEEGPRWEEHVKDSIAVVVPEAAPEEETLEPGQWRSQIKNPDEPEKGGARRRSSRPRP